MALLLGLRCALVGTSFVGCAASTAYAVADDASRDGYARATRLYLTAGPAVAHYRWVEQRQRLRAPASEAAAAAEWEALDAYWAPPVIDMLKELKGMYTKYGQMAAGLTSVASKTWSEGLRELEDAVPARPAADVLRTVHEETGDDPKALFAEFADQPLGAASIGQVHAATLRATGERVAVKVQYPDAARRFALDMRTIRTFCAWFAPEQLIILDELTRQLEAEFDYTQEARNLALVDANLRRAGLAPGEVAVPRPIEGLSTRRMLVMEMLPGPKLVDGVRAYAKQIAEREGVSLEQFEAVKRAELDERGVAPRYEGPSARSVSLFAAWLRLKDGLHNTCSVAYDLLVARPLGKPRARRRHTAPPPNAPRIMDALMRVHGHQLLVDGVFQADPHAGNFLLMPDGRVGLIDYGATKRLTRGERLSAAVLYAALARGDRDTVLRLCRIGGYKSRHMDPEVAFKLCQFGFSTYGRDLLGDKNIQQFIDSLHAADPLEQAADNLVLASLLSVRLRAVALSLNHPVVCAEYWGSLAEDVLRREGMPYEVWLGDAGEALMREHLTDNLRIAKGAAG